MSFLMQFVHLYKASSQKIFNTKHYKTSNNANKIMQMPFSARQEKLTFFIADA